MEILLNGEPHQTKTDVTVEELLVDLELQDRRVALLLDDEVVRKGDFAQTSLREGCRVEIIQMVGGG